MLTNSDYITTFVPKFVNIEPGWLELFENVVGVWFFKNTM